MRDLSQVVHRTPWDTPVPLYTRTSPLPMEFSQMFWAGRAFHVSWVGQRQSENRSCPILRALESLSKPVTNARRNRRASSSPQLLGAKQSSVQAVVDDCCGFWMGPLFDFRRPKFWYVFNHTCPPPPPKCPPPHAFFTPPPPPPRKCILDNCRNVAKTVTQPALSGRRQV